MGSWSQLFADPGFVDFGGSGRVAARGSNCSFLADETHASDEVSSERSCCVKTIGDHGICLRGDSGTKNAAVSGLANSCWLHS